MSKTPGTRLPPETLAFKQTRGWAAWLARHHAASVGVWLRLERAGIGGGSLTHPQALELALTYGWIDGQRRSNDSRSWLVKFVPRGPRSIWSKVNREKAQELIRAGRMKPTGLRAVKQAQADGRWATAYDPPSRAVVPPDLAAALRQSPEAKAFFATLNSQNRYAILHRLQTAKRPETRARRLATFLAMLETGKTIHP